MAVPDEQTVMNNAKHAVIAARKAVDEARRAIENAEYFFREAGIDSESPELALAHLVDPTKREEVDGIVAAALQEIDRQAEEAIRGARGQHLNPAIKRGTRSLI